MTIEYLTPRIIGRSGTSRHTRHTNGITPRSALGMSAYISNRSLVVSAAAYASGKDVYSNLDGNKVRPPRKRHEDLIHAEISAPGGAPDWCFSRELVWNKVEAQERRKDSQLARDLIGALQRELTTEQQIAFMREFVQESFTSQGMICDWAIHSSPASDGGKNPHAHMLLTMRRIDGDGFHRLKATEWNRKEMNQRWRDNWETLTLKYLRANGVDSDFGMKSYAARGIDKVPQKKMGYKIDRLERDGVPTEVGNHNRRVRHRNAVAAIEAAYEPPGAEQVVRHAQFAELGDAAPSRQRERGAARDR